MDNKILGLIYGQCIGDAVGLPTEFKFSADNHIVKFPYDKPIGNFPLCDWTDDSDHMIIVMMSLTENKFLDQLDIAQRLKLWVECGFKELGDTYGVGLGGLMSSVIREPDFIKNPTKIALESWEKSGKKIASNGSLMRTSIISCIVDYDKMLKSSYNLCIITHADPRCIASCIMYNSVIHDLMYSKLSFDKIFVRGVLAASKYIRDEKPILLNTRRQPTPDYYYDTKFSTRLEELIYYARLGYSGDLKSLKLDEVGRIGYVFKCLGVAMYGLYSLKKGLSYKDTITEIASECGDADTNCSVVGALMGAMIGYDNLPKSWIDSLPNKSWLDEKIPPFIDVIEQNLNLKIYDDHHGPSYLQ